MATERINIVVTENGTIRAFRNITNIGIASIRTAKSVQQLNTVLAAGNSIPRLSSEASVFRKNLTGLNSAVLLSSRNLTNFIKSLSGVSFRNFSNQVKSITISLSSLNFTNIGIISANFNKIASSALVLQRSLTRLNVTLAVTNKNLNVFLRNSGSAFRNLSRSSSQSFGQFGRQAASVFGSFGRQTASVLGSFGSQAIRVFGNFGTASARSFGAFGVNTTRVLGQFGRQSANVFRAFSRNASSSFRSVNRSASSVGQTLLNVRNIIATLITGRAFQVFTDYADQWRVLSNRVNLYTDSANESISVQKRLFNISQATRTELSTSGQLFNRLNISIKTLGASQEDILQVIANLNKALRISGSTSAESSGALIQLSQALGNNFRSSAQEINSIVEQTPRIAQIIADAFGVVPSQLKQLASEGLIDAQAVFKALLNSTDELNKEFQNLTPTFAELFTTLRNRAVRFLGEFNEQFNITGKLGRFIENIISAFKNLGNLISRTIIPTFIKLNERFNITERISDVFNFLINDARRLALVVTSFLFPALTSVVGSGLVVFLTSSIPLFITLGLGIISLYDNSELFRNSIKESFNFIQNQIPGIISLFNTLSEAIQSITNNIPDINLDAAVGSVGVAVAFIFESVRLIINSIGNTIGAALESIVNFFRNNINGIISLFKGLGNFIGGFVATIVVFFKNLTNNIINEFKRINFSSLFAGLITGDTSELENLFSGIGDAFLSSFNIARDVASDASDDVSNDFADVGNSIKSSFEFFPEIFGIAKEGFNDLIETGKSLPGVFDLFVEGLVDRMEKLTNETNNASNAVKGLSGSISNENIDSISRVFEAIPEIDIPVRLSFQTFEITSGIDKIGQSILNLIPGAETAFGVIGDLASDLSDSISGIVESIVGESVFGVIQSGLNKISMLYNDFLLNLTMVNEKLVTTIKEGWELIFSTIDNIINQTSSLWTEFLTQGSVDFRKFIISITSEIARLLTNNLLRQFISFLLPARSPISVLTGPSQIGTGSGGFATPSTNNFGFGIFENRNTSGFGSFNDFIPGRQFGGTVTQNDPFIVGERGPELFIPSSAGRVANQNQISGNQNNQGVTIINNVDPEMLSSYLSTNEGQQLIVNTINQNSEQLNI